MQDLKESGRPAAAGTLVTRPLGVGWERGDSPARMPRALALFWPVLPALIWLAVFLATGQLFWALYLAAVWLLLTLPLTAHPRLLRQVQLPSGALEHQMAWGPTHRAPAARFATR
ncbi:MAG: hypothetical protein ACRENX_00345 [Candidatus Dormibacteria bacterium]